LTLNCLFVGGFSDPQPRDDLPNGLMICSRRAPWPVPQAMSMASPTSGDLPMRLRISIFSSIWMPRAVKLPARGGEIGAYTRVAAHRFEGRWR